VNSFVKRTITGVIFVILIIGSVILSHWAFATLFLVVSLGGLFEFFKIAKALGSNLNKSLLILIATLVYSLISLTVFGFFNPSILIYGLLVFPVIMGTELFRKTSTPLANIAYSIAGLLWIVVPLALLNGFFNLNEGPAWHHSGALLGFFLILWIYDSGAYIFGSLFGRRRMLERISPKKSWEGFVGGVLLGVLTAFMISASFIEFSLSRWMIIALMIIIFGTLGDLTESMLKRSAGIKDSGSILPGHGGILDRFDAVFIAAPVIFILIFLFRGA
jgi:phosphatidate cytidylyltransferase